MSSEFKRLDTTGEFHASGAKDLAADRSGQWMRIVFVESDHKTEMPMVIAAELLDQMMPAIMHLAGECDRRRTGKNAKRSFVIKQGSVGATEQGGVVLEFAAPSGQSYSFEMDANGARAMLGSLSKALGLISEHGTAPPSSLS